MDRQQAPLGNDEIGQGKQAEELRRVLRQALVADLLVAEQVLHDVKRMLHLRAYAGLQLLGLLEQPRPLAREVELAALAPAASLRASAAPVLLRACSRRGSPRRRRPLLPRRAAARRPA